MAEVKWSLTASHDLEEIEDFIARDSVLHTVFFSVQEDFRPEPHY